MFGSAVFLIGFRIGHEYLIDRRSHAADPNLNIRQNNLSYLKPLCLSFSRFVRLWNASIRTRISGIPRVSNNITVRILHKNNPENGRKNQYYFSSENYIYTFKEIFPELFKMAAVILFLVVPGKLRKQISGRFRGRCSGINNSATSLSLIDGMYSFCCQTMRVFRPQNGYCGFSTLMLENNSPVFGRYHSRMGDAESLAICYWQLLPPGFWCRARTVPASFSSTSGDGPSYIFEMLSLNCATLLHLKNTVQQGTFKHFPVRPIWYISALSAVNSKKQKLVWFLKIVEFLNSEELSTFLFSSNDRFFAYFLKS